MYVYFNVCVCMCNVRVCGHVCSYIQIHFQYVYTSPSPWHTRVLYCYHRSRHCISPAYHGPPWTSPGECYFVFRFLSSSSFFYFRLPLFILCLPIFFPRFPIIFGLLVFFLVLPFSFSFFEFSFLSFLFFLHLYIFFFRHPSITFLISPFPFIYLFFFLSLLLII